MTFLGVAGILLGLLAWPFAMVQRTRVRVFVFGIAYLLHLAASITYYLYSKDNVVDATGYYFDYLGFSADGFGLSTQFIYFVVQGSREFFGGTMLDYFLVFQVIGFYGICLMMRVFEELHSELGVEQPPYTYLLLLLPGLHFWTSAIGKDAPLFFGVCLALWSSMAIRKRYVWFAFGILVVLLIRPHIALVAVAAIAGALVFDQATRFRTKMFLVISALVGLVVAATTIQSTFALDVTNADSVSDFLARQEEVTKNADVAGNTAVYGNFLVRLLSLLFRPLFFDADDMFGYIASAENFILLIIVGTIVFKVADVMVLARRVTFLRFASLLSMAVALILTLVYYNVGLGLRQKTMFTPALIIIFVALLAVRRGQGLAVGAEAASSDAVSIELAHPRAPI